MFRALALASLMATPALADEVWDSDIGAFVYQDEADGAAVFTFRNFDGAPATLVIPGLAGNFDNRGVHDAFWIGRGQGNCLGSMSWKGDSSQHWGTAVLIFDKPAYPTSFTLMMGDCFDLPNYSTRAIIR